MALWNRLFLVCALLFALSALCGPAPLRRSSPPALTARRERWILAGIVLLALWARLWDFGVVPGGVNQDGAMAAVDAGALAGYGTDRFGMLRPVYFTAWGYGQMSVMMSYLMAPLIRLFGMNVYTLRLPCLLCSLGGLGCLYFFARRAWGRGAALAVLFIAAVNPWHIMQSRWGLDCNLYPHFLLAGIWLLHKGVEGERKWVCLSMIPFGLSVYCYGIAGYTTPLFLLLCCAVLLGRKKVTWREAGLCVLLFLLLAWPFFAVLIINTFRLPTWATPLFTMPRFPDTVRSSDLLFFSENIPRQLWENLKNAVGLILLQHRDLPWNEVEGFGTLYLFSLPLAALGAWTLWRRRGESGSAMTLLLFATGFLNALLVRGTNINRANLVFYAMVIFVGVGLWRCVCSVRVGWAALPALYLCAFLLFSHSYFGTWNEEISRHFLADFGEAVTAAEGADVEAYYITQNSQYERAAAVSEILTLYYHDVDARWYRSGEYRERYHYGDETLWPLEGERVAYVVRAESAPRFEEAGYRVKYYGRFALAVPAA